MMHLDVYHLEKKLRKSGVKTDESAPVKDLEGVRFQLEENKHKESFCSEAIGSLLQNLILISGDQKQLQIEFLKLKIQYNFATLTPDNVVENFKLLRALDPEQEVTAKDLYTLMIAIAYQEASKSLVGNREFLKLCKEIGSLLEFEEDFDKSDAEILYCESQVYEEDSSERQKTLVVAAQFLHKASIYELYEIKTLEAKTAEENKDAHKYNLCIDQRWNVINSAYKSYPDEFRAHFVQCLIDNGDNAAIARAQSIVAGNSEDRISVLTYLRGMSQREMLLNEEVLELAQENVFAMTDANNYSEESTVFSLLLYGVIALKLLPKQQDFIRGSFEESNQIIETFEQFTDVHPIALMFKIQVQQLIDPNEVDLEELFLKRKSLENLSIAEVHGFLAANDIEPLLKLSSEGSIIQADAIRELQDLLVLSYSMNRLNTLDILIQSQEELAYILGNTQEEVKLQRLRNLNDGILNGVQADDSDTLEENSFEAISTTESFLLSWAQDVMEKRGLKTLHELYFLDELPMEVD